MLRPQVGIYGEERSNIKLDEEYEEHICSALQSFIARSRGLNNIRWRPG